MSLSGGIDGAFLLASLQKTGNIDQVECCYTVEFGDFSEVEIASRIAEYFGKEHRVVKYSYEEFLNDLSFSSDTLEGPTGGLMNLGLSSLAKQVNLTATNLC